MRALSFSLAVLRDAAVVAVVAVLTVQALRRFVADRYLVPSDSMQPVLYGDPEHGDVVLVDKTVAAASRRRGDLVVVEHPDKPGHQLVKRIAACGDDLEHCWIDIHNGDVWLGPNQQQMQREVKDPIDARARFVRWAEVPGTVDAAAMLAIDCPASRDAWLLAPMASVLDEARSVFRPRAREARRRDPHASRLPAGCIGTARSVDCSYLDADGRRSATGREIAVIDCSMAFELRGVVDAAADATACADAVLCTIETGDATTTFAWRPATGALLLWRDGDDVEAAELPPVPVGAATVEFGHLDGRVYFVVDGRRDALFTAARATERTLAKTATYLYLAIVGERRGAIGAIRVCHDVYAWRDPIITAPGQPPEWPKLVPRGAWFLLGDNAFDSRDSRQLGPLPMSSFLGVPRLVVGPWSRRRWLDR